LTGLPTGRAPEPSRPFGERFSVIEWLVVNGWTAAQIYKRLTEE
jgi:hypothetical protein